MYKITHYTRHGGVVTFNDDDYNDYVDKYEDMWDYVKVEDENGKIIYETLGLDKFRKELGIES